MKYNQYDEDVRRLHSKGKNFSQIATTIIIQYGLEQTKHRVLRKYASELIKDSGATTERKDSRKWVENKDAAEVVFTTDKHIETFDEAVAHSGADLDVWEADRWEFNKWPTTFEGRQIQLIQVKIKFKRRDVNKVSMEEVRKSIIEEMKAHAPSYETIKYNFKSKDRNLLEINLFDVHFGKLAWHEESDSNYDLKIASDRVYEAVEGLLKKAEGFPIERIVLPTGNDLFNADQDYPFSATTNGTPQHEDARWQRTFRTVRSVMIDVIERLSTIAPVDVPIVPGNHDKTKCFFLGDSLEGWMQNNPQVSIDNSPRMRKYYMYGQNLLGLTHGDKEKLMELPLIMAQEVPEMWANTIHREFHLGHFHQKKDVKWQSTQEFKGVVVRLLRSLSGTDAWHYEKGYVGGARSAEAFVWNDRGGVVANLIHTIEG